MTQQHDNAVGSETALPQSIVRLSQVHKAFGDLTVLRGVSLGIERGRNTVIIGPSGTGKSVLLKIIVGLLRPDSGEVFFDNERIDNLREREMVDVRKRIGFLFQMGALFDSMNVERNVCFPLEEHTDLRRDERRERCARMLKLVGLDGVQSKMPANLSGGQRKRVALARAIVLEPEMVLYDEPTTGLDPIRADLINELIVSLNRQLGMTGIVVTHDMASAEKVGDRMLMLSGGQMIADAEPTEFRRLDDALVRRFVDGRAEPDELERIRAAFADVSAATE